MIDSSATPDDRAWRDYDVFGLRIRSAIPLPDLMAAPVDRRRADVRIVLGDVAPAAADAASVWGLTGTGERAVLTIDDIARFEILAGRRIVVDRFPDAPAANVRLFLLGSAIGALLHQRGLLPLHANAIRIGRGAAAFMGPSGAGKSTLAAAFLDRGFTLLADDVCVVEETDRLPMAQPGLPRLRLWRDAVEASGRHPDDLQIAFAGHDKYVVPTHDVQSADAMPLNRIYLLGALSEGETGMRIRRLTGIAAVSAVMANIYRGRYLSLLGGRERNYRQCLQLIRAVPVFSVERQWGHDAMDAQIRAIERHAKYEVLA